MSNIICPVCGSDKIAKNVSMERGRIPAGPEFTYEQEYYTCGACTEVGDFAQVNDDKYLTQYNEALAVSVKQQIDDLSDKFDISMAYFERAFELPMRTLTRWKNGEFSATAVALLRVVTQFPWISEVAENQFNPVFADNIMLNNAVTIFNAKMETGNLPFVNFTITSGVDSVVIDSKYDEQTAIAAQLTPTVIASGA